MSRYRVMVVDDDPDVRYVVTSLLAMDFETVQASNGLDALEKFERYEPDLLLLDVMMPVMNGIHCCSSVRRREDFGDLPVFFLSASADPKVREEAREAGATDFIEKPFDTAALIDRIRGYLYGERRPPRVKLFTMREIEKIDVTPLKAADHEEAEVAAGSVTASSEFAPPPAEDGDGKRKRRVFGKVRVEPVAGGASQTAIPMNLVPPVSGATPHLEVPPGPVAPTPAVAEPRRPAPIPPTADPHSLPAPSSHDVQKPTPLPRVPAAIPPTADPYSLPAPIASDIFAAPPPPIDPDVFAAAPPPVAPRGPVPVPPTASPEVFRPAAPVAGRSRFSEEQRAEAREILAQRAARALGAGPGARKAGVLLPRVLVLIDVPESLPVAHEALRGLAEFLPLEDPVEAVELIARFQPDIVVAGIRTPKYSGLELGKMLQGSVRLAHTQLLYVVGNRSTDADANAARRMSGNDLLFMPLKADLMHAAVARIISKPGFQVREKGLSYGVYVKEVLKSAEAERAKVNKELEKAAFRKKTMGIESFMARELAHLMPAAAPPAPPPTPPK